MKIIPKVKGEIQQPRGRMMKAAEIATELYFGKVKAKWVLENVPHKMRFGHRTVLWYRDDVLAYIESQRESAA